MVQVNQTVGQYIMLWTIFFFMFGTIWYNLDRRFGVNIYRWWYNLTHKNALPEDKDVGFIYNRSIKARVTFAFVVSTLQSILAWKIQVDPLAEVFMWIAEVPIMLVGFYCGPVTYSLWQKKEAFYETIDDIENGRRDLKEEARDAMHNAASAVREAADDIMEPIMETVDDLKDSFSGSSGEEEIESPAEPEVSQAEQELLNADPRELMDQFKKRRR